jgi:hypothetical protein
VAPLSANADDAAAVAAGFGWALIDVTGGMEILSIVIPWPRLAETLVVAVAAGVLAATWPAFRVSRVPVLELVRGGPLMRKSHASIGRSKTHPGAQASQMRTPLPSNATMVGP